MFIVIIHFVPCPGTLYKDKGTYIFSKNPQHQQTFDILFVPLQNIIHLKHTLLYK